MHRIIALILIITSLSSFTGCESFGETRFSDIEEGEAFGHNIDGYHKKLPHNYCLFVLLGETTRLIKVPDNMLDKDYFLESVYNTPPVLKGRYIKGYYNDDYLILYEQLSLDSYEYILFDFTTQEINRYERKKDLPDYKSIKWFSLCNTLQEKYN
ncbi:MAG: hypothetical protein E7652_03505 [Ruminococcaceae bacterium]|nr:hypothetical protein [Oscillospiraceae bacterium]